MRIAITGAGRVGTALAHRFVELGHTVAFGVRDPRGDAKKIGKDFPDSRVLSVPEAAADADLVVLAVPFAAARDAVAALGDLGGKVLIDVTNPFGRPAGTVLSGAEEIAGWAVNARVVKAFNYIGAPNMGNPVFEGGAAMGLVAGDDDDARKLVLDLAAAVGFDPIDLGPLANAELAESLARIWTTLAYRLGHGPNVGIALLHR